MVGAVMRSGLIDWLVPSPTIPPAVVWRAVGLGCCSAVGTAVFVVAAVVVVVGVVAVFVVVVVDGRGHSVSVGNLGIDVLLPLF